MQGAIDESLSDIVRDYKLVTRYEGKDLTVHLHNDPDTPPSAPQRQERWKKVRTIGQGGQSEVILETCVDGGRHLTERAVKKIRLQRGDSKRRYESELGAIVKFSHDRYSKYFVKSLGWFASSRKLYIAMEYFPAGDLYSYVRQHEVLPEEDCRQITSQLLSAIAVMHSEGFAHRDIKPRNILIHSHPQDDAQGLWWVKLGDFGISRKIGADPDSTVSSVGTTLYMAPELLQIDSSDERSSNFLETDIWALGITVFFILTKAVPFQSPASTVEFAKNSGEPFPHAFLDHHHVSDEGQAFLREALRPKPKTRLDFNMAMHHAWIQTLFPSVPVSGSQSRRSTISSRRSSIHDDRITDGLTTEISTLSSQPALQGQCGEGHHAVSPEPKATSNGRFKTTSMYEGAADAHTGIDKRSFVERNSVKLVDIQQPNESTHLGQVEDLRILLDQVVTLTTSQYGDSPLHVSAWYGHMEVTRLLCDMGVSIEAKNKNGSTALSLAALEGKNTTVELLLRKGANIEARDNNGNTALALAALEGRNTTIELLLQKGANIEARDNNGNTALALAALEGKDTIVQLLLKKGANIEAKDDNGNAPLAIAASTGNNTIVRLLLEKGAEIEAKDDNGNAALAIATSMGNNTTVELLLKKGADTNTRNVHGNTALAVAASEEKEITIKLLLEKGANIEAKNGDGHTVLNMAAYNGGHNIVELLLQNGANPNARGPLGYTALIMAITRRKKRDTKAVVTLLLEHGANINARDNFGDTCFTHALKTGDKELIDLFIRHRAANRIGIF